MHIVLMCAGPLVRRKNQCLFIVSEFGMIVLLGTQGEGTDEEQVRDVFCVAVSGEERECVELEAHARKCGTGPQ